MKKVILIILFFLPISAFAQSVPKYVQIVNIPNVNPGDINTYMNSLYVLAITIAALLAVIKIVIAGVKWMTTDIVTSKGDAKKDIQGALLGLLIILSVVLIIELINPDIGTVDLKLEVVDVPESPVTPAIDPDVLACEESATCEVLVCSEDSPGPPPTYDCTTKIEQCRREGGVINDSVGDYRILCIKAGAESPVEREAGAADDALRAFIAENDSYTEVIEIYAINQREQETNTELTPGEISAMIDTWTESCEVDGEGNDTGYTYREIEDIARGVYVRACLN